MIERNTLHLTYPFVYYSYLPEYDGMVFTEDLELLLSTLEVESYDLSVEGTLYYFKLKK